MKLHQELAKKDIMGRPPRGGRGLKHQSYVAVACRRSRPPRGGRGLKHGLRALRALEHPSPPTRGAWIETMTGATMRPVAGVAPHAGGVD